MQNSQVITILLSCIACCLSSSTVSHCRIDCSFSGVHLYPFEFYGIINTNSFFMKNSRNKSVSSVKPASRSSSFVHVSKEFWHDPNDLQPAYDLRIKSLTGMCCSIMAPARHEPSSPFATAILMVVPDLFGLYKTMMDGIRQTLSIIQQFPDTVPNIRLGQR